MVAVASGARRAIIVETWPAATALGEERSCGAVTAVTGAVESLRAAVSAVPGGSAMAASSAGGEQGSA